MFEDAGLSHAVAQYATAGTGVVNVGMTFVSAILMDKLGRRTLMIIGLGGMFVFTVMLTVALVFQVICVCVLCVFVCVDVCMCVCVVCVCVFMCVCDVCVCVCVKTHMHIFLKRMISCVHVHHPLQETCLFSRFCFVRNSSLSL